MSKGTFLKNTFLIKHANFCRTHGTHHIPQSRHTKGPTKHEANLCLHQVLPSTKLMSTLPPPHERNLSGVESKWNRWAPTSGQGPSQRRIMGNPQSQPKRTDCWSLTSNKNRCQDPKQSDTELKQKCTNDKQRNGFQRCKLLIESLIQNFDFYKCLGIWKKIWGVLVQNERTGWSAGRAEILPSWGRIPPCGNPRFLHFFQNPLFLGSFSLPQGGGSKNRDASLVCLKVLFSEVHPAGYCTESMLNFHSNWKYYTK